MKLVALLGEIEQTLQRDDSTANEHIVLAQKIVDLADMVGWASGPIDPEGRLAERLQSIMQALRSRHERTDEASIATLHDTIAGLHETVDKHDRDLAPSSDVGEDEVY